MTLKRKLTWGLGFLFFIIFSLGIFFSYEIGRLSDDAANIVKDNYNSLVYAKSMTAALEDMRTAITRIVFNPAGDRAASEYYAKLFEAGRVEFENNLGSEKSNITEIHEGESVRSLEEDYGLYAGICSRILKTPDAGDIYFSEYETALDKLRRTVGSITDLNMQAVERKNQMAKRDAARIINVTAGIGVVCAILGFFYFWYFPFYVSNTIAYLADRMKKLLEKAGLTLDIKTKDESFIILQGLTLLENISIECAREGFAHEKTLS
jgi:two-component system, NtrC family, sensor histidine kinase KinB